MRKTILKKSLKLILLFVSLSSLSLSACAQSPQLPIAAQDALIAHWDSLPADPGIENNIIRAWPGISATEEGSPAEIWCVKAEVISTEESTLGGGQMLWVVFRDGEAAPWTAMLQAAMSSLWPYAACDSGALKR